MVSETKGFVGLLIVLASFCVVSCTSPEADQETMIAPGDKIGAMTVEQGTANTEYAWIWEYCEGLVSQLEPGTQIVDCTVPSEPGLAFMIGFSAEESRIDSIWDLVTFEAYIDDYRLDLDRFEWEESDPGAYGVTRFTIIHLLNPSPGEHSFRNLWSADEPIDDGFDIYAPGVYESIVNFTVSE